MEQKAITAIRILAADAIQKAKSGHPGLAIGSAPMAYALWKQMKHDPKHPDWPARDRFVLSAGHGSMLEYALLHLYGYGLTMDDVKTFRQWGSKTPGHPEYGHTAGVEATTGPLGQGFATAVGMAIAEAHEAAVYNREGFQIVDNYTYVLMGDGCMQEGVQAEAASLAGTLKLGKLIALYDSNKIQIEGSTELAFTENVQAATCVIEHYCAVTGIEMRKNNGITYRDNQTGFNWCTRPIVCIEMGHMSNENEDLLLTNEQFQDKMAVGIFDGILAYFHPDGNEGGGN